MNDRTGALLLATTILLLLLATSVTRRTYCLDPLQEARCLNCIKNVTNLLGIDTTKRCEGYYCGQYQLSYSYWVEAGKPGNSQGARDFEKCARDKVCAEQAVKAYYRKFRKDCNNDGTIDCHDMAALHKVGPSSCSSDWFYKSRYWQAFNRTICATNRDQPSEDIRIELEEQNKQPARETRNQSLTQDCLDCICDAVSGCNTSVNNCGSGAVCGPFAISQTYWKDGRKPGASWTACARTKECSMVTVKNYMEKNKRDCNGDGLITCEDYAAIHRRGPRACINRDLFKDHYWNKFLACRANQKPVRADANMVKVYEDSEDLSSNSNSLASRDDGSATTTQSAPQSQSQPQPQPASTTTTPTTTSTTTTTPTTTSTTTTTPTPTTSVEPLLDSSNYHHIYAHHQHHQHHSHSDPIIPVVDLQPISAASELYTTTTRAVVAPITTPEPSRNVELAQSEPTQLVADYSLQGGYPYDRTSSFDRVATGIFASPDFTKSYPLPAAAAAAIEKSPAPTELPVAANQQQQQQQQQQQRLAQAAPIASVARGPPAAVANLPQSIWGSDSMNMSNLFGDKTGLNESSRIASECLECICDASSNCDTTVQCISKQREKNRCGLYMISWNQYQESDISLTSLLSIPAGLTEETFDERLYYECTTDRACAEKLIHLYIEKHQKDCNNDGKIDCYDIAAIHRVGPDSCNSGKFLQSQYWKDFNICYTTDRLTTTTTQSTASAAIQTAASGATDQVVDSSSNNNNDDSVNSRHAPPSL